MENTVLLMLSGGRDSFLSACRLLEDPKHFNVKMVTYDNGCSYRSGNAKLTADRIIQKYGDNRVEYLGVRKISGIIREFFSPYFNMKPQEQLDRFKGMTPSQFHCLICRTSMYIYSIWLCKYYGFSYIAEGGRKSQQFVVELPGMIQERYASLVRSQGIELLLPVYGLDSDWDRDNALLRLGFICKCFEPKCLIGVPVEGSIDESVILGVHTYYDEEILPRISELNMLDESFYLSSIKNNYDELYE